MARSALTVQEIVQTGLEPSYTAANADGNSIDHTSSTFVHVKNGSGVSIDVTVQTPGKVSGVDIEEVVVAVPAGEERMIPFESSSVFGQTTGDVYVDYSAVTTVTVAALRL